RKWWQRLACRSMRGQRRIARRIEQMRMCFGYEAHHAGDHDVGMADTLAEQIPRLHRRTLLFQHREHTRYLPLAARDPEIEPLLAQRALIDKAHGLVGKTGRQRAQPQVMPAPRAACRDHRLWLAREFVEMIQDDAALDQRLAVVEHQRRHSYQRI